MARDTWELKGRAVALDRRTLPCELTTCTEYQFLIYSVNAFAHEELLNDKIRPLHNAFDLGKVNHRISNWIVSLNSHFVCQNRRKHHKFVIFIIIGYYKYPPDG